MAEEYPIIINGKQQGKLRLYKQGNKTVFDAFCPYLSGLIRLSVFGEEGEGYLGVMQPGNGGMHLRRMLSMAEMRAFPGQIEYAGIKGSKPRNTETPETTWTRDQLGILHAQEKEELLCAIPSRLGIAYSGDELPARNIEGETYRVFKIGKINRS